MIVTHLTKIINRPVAQVGIFLAFWCAIVVIPLIGLVVWSFLTTKGFRVDFDPNIEGYLKLFDSGRWTVTVRTVRIATTVTIIELFVAFPFALWLAHSARGRLVRAFTLALLTIPFFLSITARTIIWRAVLGLEGIVNQVLITIGVVDEPLRWLLFSEFSVHLGLIGPFFPTMVFPIFLAAIMIDDDLLKAGRDIGGTWFDNLRNIVVPLTMPGIVAGIIFTFVPMLGVDVIPQMLGGGYVQLLGNSVHNLLTALNYSVAAAMSTFVLLIMVIFLLSLRVLLPRVGGLSQIFEEIRK